MNTPALNQPLIFISHDSRDYLLAASFAKLIKNVSSDHIKAFRSSDKSGAQGLEYGKPWFEGVRKNIEQCTEIVCLLTPTGYQRPWVSFEAGAGFMRDIPVHGIVIGMDQNDIQGPFAQEQICDLEEERMIGLITQIISRTSSIGPIPEVIRREVRTFIRLAKKQYPVNIKLSMDATQALIKAQTNIDELERKLKAMETTNAELEKEIAAGKGKNDGCCVLDTPVDRCPVGITAIRSMKDTLAVSITEAKHSFKWQGLSAFHVAINAIHDTQEAIANRPDIDFQFNIADPENKVLPKMNDEWYGKRDAKPTRELISEGNKMLQRFKERVPGKFEIQHINQIPTFRMIFIDDEKLYVSFYEKGRNALETTQLELKWDNDTPSNMFKWFKAFYDKTILNEKLLHETFDKKKEQHEQ